MLKKQQVSLKTMVVVDILRSETRVRRGAGQTPFGLGNVVPGEREVSVLEIKAGEQMFRIAPLPADENRLLEEWPGLVRTAL
jgi:hypothetical protein